MPEKPQRTKTLAQQVRWQLLWLGGGLLIACLLLLFIFTWHAAELATNSLMKLEAQSLLHQTTKNPGLALPQGESFSAYRQWQEVPESLKQHFNRSLIDRGEIIEVIIDDREKETEYLYFLHHIDDDDYGEIFLFNRYSASEVDEYFSAFLNTALNQAIWLALIIFCLLFFLVSWLIRRTTEPLQLLSQWAISLGRHPEQSLDINFSIEELNEIAMQLRGSVDRIRAFNQREQQFLKHASHELRTPLSIIQASLDTLDLQNHQATQPIVKRALKASSSMIRLSSTLLWLAREPKSPIGKSEVDIHQLCQQVIDDHRYLLKNRKISIQTRIAIDTLLIEGDLFSIVLSNLLKNAFQHSVNGAIRVDISNHSLQISNPIKAENSDEIDASTSGFGLGLQLVQRICLQQDWQFSFSNETRQVVATVSWCRRT
ncbi:MAG: HAMP domain-containing histidine kinase [Gammaproteobacteria bacterium]|nr:HAMP domain-containing histidine kinase [Gammaproteobacteria bacterium]